MQDGLSQAAPGAYGNVVLDRLCRNACRIIGVEQACILVRDRTDPRLVIVVAARGLDDDVVGRRLAADEGAVGRVLSSGHAVFLDEESRRGLAATHPLAVVRAGAAAPIRAGKRVRGVVWAGTAHAGHTVDENDRMLLCELADLASAALAHSESRARLDGDVQTRVDALAAAIALRDGYTGRHSDEVVDLARKVGARLGFERAALVELGFAARLHDVGKLKVPDEVLNKRGPLRGPELTVMREHAQAGADMLATIPGLQVVATIVRFHHERWDGLGYPDGLRGERVPLASRIIAACDAYRAMTSNRPYRAGVEPEVALAELSRHAGQQFDPAVVETLAGVVEGTRETLPTVA